MHSQKIKFKSLIKNIAVIAAILIIAFEILNVKVIAPAQKQEFKKEKQEFDNLKKQWQKEYLINKAKSLKIDYIGEAVDYAHITLRLNEKNECLNYNYL